MSDFRKGDITKLAKRIGQINKVLADACSLAEELSSDQTLQSILNDSELLLELNSKVLKYSDLEFPADMREYSFCLEEASDILGKIFYMEDSP